MIPQAFNYSQSSLTAFDQCRRRFLLRYVRRMEWPAPLTEKLGEWEQAISRGLLFHQLVLQESLGLDVVELVRKSEDPLLSDWWRNWQAQPPMMPTGEIFSETMLSVPFGAHRLVAKFDRVVIAEGGRAWILDWKTGRSKPEQSAYAGSLQTLVYRYVLAEAGAVLNGGIGIEPEDISLVYWHAQYPQALQPIGYSAAEHEAARVRLERIVNKIESLADEAAFAKTEDLDQCRRCEFHTYCDRVSERDEDWDFDEDEWDWELIPEAEL